MVCLEGSFLPSLPLIGYIQTEKLTKGMPERAYEKYAWILLFASGTISLISALRNILLPTPSNSGLPAIGGQVTGSFILGMNVFSVAIILKAFRRGERWAWYVLWFNPVLWISHFIVLGLQGHWSDAGVFDLDIDVILLLTILSLIGLLLPYRKFFPRRPTAGAMAS